MEEWRQQRENIRQEMAAELRGDLSADQEVSWPWQRAARLLCLLSLGFVVGAFVAFLLLFALFVLPCRWFCMTLPLSVGGCVGEGCVLLCNCATCAAVCCVHVLCP